MGMESSHCKRLAIGEDESPRELTNMNSWINTRSSSVFFTLSLLIFFFFLCIIRADLLTLVKEDKILCFETEQIHLDFSF